MTQGCLNCDECPSGGGGGYLRCPGGVSLVVDHAKDIIGIRLVATRKMNLTRLASALALTLTLECPSQRIPHQSLSVTL